MSSPRWLRNQLISRFLPIIILLALGMLWGGVPSIAKYVTQQGVTPLSYAFWILAISASILTIINFIRGAGLPPRHILFYIICGLTGTAVPTTVMYYSLIMIPASLMVLLITVAPIFTYLFSVIFKAERYHRLKTLGLLFAFAGILLILTPGSMSELNAPVVGILLGLLTPTFYAINIVYTVRCKPQGLHVLDMSVGMLIAAVIFMLFATLAFEPIYPVWHAPPLLILLIFYHGTLTATAFCLFYYLISISGALFSSQVTYSVTIFGIATGALVHDEVLPPLVWVAAALMLAGIGLIQTARNRFEKRKSEIP